MLKSFAMGRTRANVKPAPVPQITGPDIEAELSAALDNSFSLLRLCIGCSIQRPLISCLINGVQSCEPSLPSNGRGTRVMERI